MSLTPDQLTKLPICPVCKREQLTNEELSREQDANKRRCWFCLVESLISMGMEAAIPEPAEYGRPHLTKEDGINYAKQKFFRAAMPDVADAIAQAAATSPAPTGVGPVTQPVAPPSPTAPQKPVLVGGPSPIKFDDTQRKEFAEKFGMDPIPKNQPYEIIVHGANEDTYMKFVCPVQVDLAEQREIQRIMGGMLEIFGKLLKYGPQFAATLIELQNMSPEMFLGGRGK